VYRRLIVTGSCLFIFVLALSAVWEADIRWLHFFQAWMYLATMWLALRRNRWGYFIGIGAAGFWAFANLFVTTFFLNGLQQLAHWMHTGHMRRPDLIIAVPCLVRESVCSGGVFVGLFAAAGKIARDAGRLLAGRRSHGRILCPRYGALPAALSAAVSRNAAPALAALVETVKAGCRPVGQAKAHPTLENLGNKLYSRSKGAELTLDHGALPRSSGAHSGLLSQHRINEPCVARY
jgi:hypothetical protein